MNLQPSDAPRGRALAEAAAKVIPGGVNSATRYIGEPYAFTSAQGAYLTDLDGNSYLDYHAAFGAILLGHNAEPINRAMGAALTGLDLSGLGVTQLEIALAERICSIMPSAESMITTVTGCEATFHAIRLSRTATGRRLIVKFQGCYHGWHDAVAMNVISPRSGSVRKDPLSRGSCPRSLDADARLPLQRPRLDVERALDRARRSPRSSSSRSRTTSARCCRSPASSRGCASSRPSTARC